ncbi:MAG: glycoside hydrolase family 30 beta sandwich domain-containing protein [Salinivirgaceae bacterium]
MSLTIIIALLLASAPGCSEKNDPVVVPDSIPKTESDVIFWLTQGDQKVLFNKQDLILNFSESTETDASIEINEAIQFQTIDGFGFTLTGGSAELINSLDEPVKQALLQELFGTDNTGLGISYLRISIGASDLSSEAFTYNERPVGETDPELNTFSLVTDEIDLIPLLKQIISINPEIKLMGSPWTAPTWMKSNKSFVGGELLTEYYAVYAQYFVKYIQAMQSHGILVDAITVQNEPLHGGNNPSMLMSAVQQLDFVKNHLGPAFTKNNIETKIVIYDHNADRTDYPISILNDQEARQYIDGSAFHLYGGSIDALAQVHAAHPDKNLYFTEQWVGGPSDFEGDLKWHIENLIVGASRNWCKVVLEWNLASDPNYLPHTPGGCTSCLGALTIGNRVSRNVAYYIIAHASKFVRPGSVRIASNTFDYLPNVAFKTPDGQIVLIVLNKSNLTQTFTIKYKSKGVVVSLNNGAVGTFIWE